jgi:hypothetical protein
MRVRVRIRVVRGPIVDGIGKTRVKRADDTPTCGERYEYRRHRRARALTSVELREEVDCVLGDQRPPLINRSGEHVHVGSTTKTDFSDVDGVTTSIAEKFADALAVHLVEQKPH